MEAHAHNEPSHTESKISTPDATPSSVIKIAIFLVISIFILIMLTILVRKPKNSDRAKNDTSLNEQRIAFNISKTYDLSSTDYDAFLLFKVNPSESIKVELTNDWCPMWTSERIDTYDDNYIKRIFEGPNNIKGPKCTPTQNFIFNNTGNSSVTVKIGRCKSVSNCKINF